MADEDPTKEGTQRDRGAHRRSERDLVARFSNSALSENVPQDTKPMMDRSVRDTGSASSAIAPYDAGPQPVMDLVSRDTSQVVSALEGESLSTGSSRSYGIAGGNFRGANLGNVTHNITNIMYQAPNRQGFDHAGPSGDVNQARQDSSSSAEAETLPSKKQS